MGDLVAVYPNLAQRNVSIERRLSSPRCLKKLVTSNPKRLASSSPNLFLFRNLNKNALTFPKKFAPGAEAIPERCKNQSSRNGVMFQLKNLDWPKSKSTAINFTIFLDTTKIMDHHKKFSPSLRVPKT